MEAKLAAVISEFNLKSEQYEKTIVKLQAVFEKERKQFKHHIAKEQENAEKNVTQLKTLHATMLTEFQSKISQLETKNQLNEEVIFQLNQDLKTTKTQVKSLEKNLQCCKSSPRMENIQAQGIFNLLGAYFQDNPSAWNDVEGICMGSKR